MDLPSVSIVVEMENIQTVEPEVLGVVLGSLAAQLTPYLDRFPKPPQLIFSYPGEPEARDDVLRRIRQDGPGLAEMDLSAVGVPDGRYYEMKNAGAALADGEILIFADSDAPPEGPWLNRIFEAFDNPDTVSVSGHTFLKHDDFLSRTLALIWIFPLEHGDEREANRRSIRANNVAFRREWFARLGGFPYDPGFKVSCFLLHRKLIEVGKDCLRVDARARHEPLRGWRFLAWRAAVTGRDADRKVSLTRSEHRGKRLLQALKRWGTMMWRTTRRIISKRKIVGMPWWEVPAALLLGWTFYTIAFANQFASAAGWIGGREEHIPALFEPH